MSTDPLPPVVIMPDTTTMQIKFGPRRTSHILLVLLSLGLLAPVFSQNQAGEAVPGSSGTAVVLRQAGSGPYTLVERSDWARYDNGTYIGHVYRELRYQLMPVQVAEGLHFSGTVYVFEETLRDLQKSARSLDSIIPLEFTISPSGFINIKKDEGFPTLRNFPLFIDKPLKPGDRWVGQGQRLVDPRNDGNRVSLPIVVEYVFQGEELYKGEAVYRIRAQYATRYKGPVRSGQAVTGAFSEATGKHVVDILLRTADSRPVLMRDTLDETFTWSDGSSVRYKGFTLTFSEGFLPFDRGAVVAQLAREFGGGSGDQSGAENPAAGKPMTENPVAGKPAAEPAVEMSASQPMAPATATAGTEAPQRDAGAFQLDQGGGGSVLDLPAQNIEIAAVPEGVKLTVRDIRFVADSDEILPAERDRLDMIAQALKSVLQGRPIQPMILVEGHTAAVGKSAGEQELSVKRAKKIVDELAARGIPVDRFMYKGWGGTKPIADNSTEAGRAKNRRVEITILQ
jgi:outer membrane protein OmpA-like peptidoglycan-associated protein